MWRVVWGLETGVGNGMGSLFKCFISHFYFQESRKLAFEVSELDWLAPWGRGGGAGPVGVAASAFSGASLPKISLCGWPALASLPVIS